MFGLTARGFPDDGLPTVFIRQSALSISALADCSICVSPGLLQNGMDVCCYGVNQFAAGVAIHGAELTVEGFKLDTGALNCCRFILAQHTYRRRRREAVQL